MSGGDTPQKEEYYGVPCPQCGEPMRRATGDPQLDAIVHLADHGILELAIVRPGQSPE